MEELNDSEKKPDMSGLFDSPLRIFPMGGLGEIGLNMMVMEYGGKLLIIDCGLMFPEDTMLGVDVVIPDFSFFKDRAKDILALILTHGHEDHIGAAPFFLQKFNVPIYGTKLTLAFLQNKLSEYKIDNPNLNLIDIEKKVVLGDFKLEFVRVAHSIMDGVGMGIETPEGLVVHSGDFKLDFAHSGSHTTDIRSFSNLGNKNVLCLLSDSTNVEQYGYTMSEQEVGEKLSDVFRDLEGRIIITLFASNIARIQQIFNIAQRYGRKVCVSGRSMVANINTARKLGYLKCGKIQFLDIKDLPRQSRRRTVILTTGSQGEPMSVLSRIATGHHKQILIIKGDTVILSSKFIPGNEGTIAALINRIYQNGAKVVYETIREVHTSGHAHREELKLMFKLIHPKYFIPVHGEIRHLVQHCRLANDMGVGEDNTFCLKNGDMVEFQNRKGKITKEAVPVGRVFVDGKGIGDVGNIVLTDRRLLSENGVVTCVIVYDEKTEDILGKPKVMSKGFVYEPENRDLFEDLIDLAMDTFNEFKKDGSLNEEGKREKLGRILKRTINKRMLRRPLVIPVLIKV